LGAAGLPGSFATSSTSHTAALLGNRYKRLPRIMLLGFTALSEAVKTNKKETPGMLPDRCIRYGGCEAA